MVQSPGGAFLTKVDIFFATKDSKVPVNLEIREVVNGYPGKVILPFSRVSLKPEQVNLSDSTVDLNGSRVRKYDTATSFVFPSPVYVQDNQEYAIVLFSDSNNYQVWISQLGDQIPGSARDISEQPYMGVFFKSQNASTWTADQSQDLKFTIYKAQFATNTIGNVEFVNSALPYSDLETNPLETRIRQTKVRVWHRNHGMPVGSKVIITDADETKLTGIDGTGRITIGTGIDVAGLGTSFTTELEVGSALYNTDGQYIGIIDSITDDTSALLRNLPQQALMSELFKIRPPIHGIPATEIYTTHTISDVDINSYCIPVGTSPTVTGYAGGSTMRATHNIQFDAFQPTIQMQTFPETNVTFGMLAVSGKSPDSPTQQAYVTPKTFSEILVNENNEVYEPKMIASEINETVLMSGRKSLTLRATIMTNNANVSPIIDTHRTSFVAINNKINYPQETNINVAGLDDNVLVENSSAIVVSGNQITTANVALRDIFKTVTIGKYMTIRGSTSGESTVLITDFADDGSSITFATEPFATSGDITLIQREMFVDEITPVSSSAFSKYVTKQVKLANPSNYIRIRFAASIPPEAAVDVYYRTTPVGSAEPLDILNWTKVNPDSPVVNVQVGSYQFIDMAYSTGDLNAFNTMQVKLVMRSTNTAAVPLIKDLRIIACA